MIVAVVVVAIIIVAAVGVFFMGGGDKSLKIESALPVYGNANGDYEINDKDVDLIQEIIDGKKTLASYPLADANNDGKVNQKDIDQTKAIINKTAKTVWHINQIDDKKTATESKWPIKAAVGFATMNIAMFYKMLGIEDAIKAVAFSNAAPPDYYFIPKLEKAARGSTSSTSFEYEVASQYVISDGVTAMITSTNSTYLKNWQDFEDHGIDVIRIDATGVKVDNFLSSVLFLSFMFDTTADGKAYKICELSEKIMNDVTTKTKKIAEADAVIAIACNTAGTLTAPTSDYTKLLVEAGGKMISDSRYTGSINMKNDSGAWVYEVKLDKMVGMRVGSALGGSWYKGTISADKLTEMYDYCKLLQCYKNNDCYCISGELPIPLRLAYAAEVLYPDVFGQGYADKYHQQFCDMLWPDDKWDISKMTFIYKMLNKA